MKTKCKKITATIFLLIMVFSLQNFMIFASSGSGTVKVTKYQAMVQAETGISRSTRYSYVDVTVNSVYPTGTYTEDNFTKCTACIYHHSLPNVMLSQIYTLEEGTGVNHLEIKQGYLNILYVDLYFAGNNPNYEAYVAYTYDGK